MNRIVDRIDLVLVALLAIGAIGWVVVHPYVAGLAQLAVFAAMIAWRLLRHHKRQGAQPGTTTSE